MPEVTNLRIRRTRLGSRQGAHVRTVNSVIPGAIIGLQHYLQRPAGAGACRFRKRSLEALLPFSGLSPGMSTGSCVPTPGESNGRACGLDDSSGEGHQ